MNKSRIIYSIGAMLFGGFMIVFGGIDDSPGAQLLGLLLVIAGIVGIIKGKFRDWLLYITNNEKKSRHEEGFDIVFFFVNTSALILGTTLLLIYDEPQWIAFLVIEYSWALDNMRHNRP